MNRLLASASPLSGLTSLLLAGAPSAEASVTHLLDQRRGLNSCIEEVFVIPATCTTVAPSA
jgi:hypothetical protein